MVLYSCNICNFSTNKTTNYNRHLQTKKHLKNVEFMNLSNDVYTETKKKLFTIEDNRQQKKTLQHNIKYDSKKQDFSKKYPEVSTSIQNAEEEKFCCIYCNKIFSHKNNYYRHMKHRCRKKVKQEINNVSIDEYKKLVNKLLESQDKLITEKDKRIQEKDDTLFLFLDNKHILSNNITNNNTYHQTNNTLNNTNYVLNYINYSEADSMDSIRDKFKLTRDEFIKASLTKG